jgi:pyrimidine-nucleoside phosphorylase
MTRSILDLIIRKRDGGALTSDEISFLVQAITAGEVADYQISALLMAIYLRGLTQQETIDLTMAMVRSGETIDLSAIEGFKVDKHSTGGVGDKVSLILGPLLAATGVRFPKLSGRGLAHTGGTLDKLESIPGMRVDLSLREFIQQVQAIGLAITGQTADLVPADGILYALRDVTGTVDSIPLIASSVMSKKIAAGADGILLDVKCGRGAFMKTRAAALELAQQMVTIGRAAGKQTLAVITAMDQPLGHAVGNALEVAEAIEALWGQGPSDLLEEVLSLGAYALQMASLTVDVEHGKHILREKIKDGSALDRLRQMIAWQGGDARVVDDRSLLPRAPRVIAVHSQQAGYVQHVDALKVGTVALKLGAGRYLKGEPVDPAVGVMLHAKAGDSVEPGSVLAELHVPASGQERYPIEELAGELRMAYSLGIEPPPPMQPVLEVVAGEGNL